METSNRRDKWLPEMHSKKNKRPGETSSVSSPLEIDEKKELEDKLKKAEKKVCL